MVYIHGCKLRTVNFTGGLGGVLVNEQTEVCAWFGICLDESRCISLGGDCKGTIIYELELLATVLATCVWCQERSEILHGIFGENDSVRFSSIQTVASGVMDQRLMEYQLRLGAEGDLRSWYACVPTEANISGWPSRSQPHELLDSALTVSGQAWEKLQTILRYLAC